MSHFSKSSCKALFSLIFLPIFSFATIDISKVNSLFSNVESALNAISLVVVTIAILIVGYKVLFGGQTIRECTPVIVGSIIIASASQIAKLFVG